jgi:hypothetical protein
VKCGDKQVCICERRIEEREELKSWQKLEYPRKVHYPLNLSRRENMRESLE